MGFDMPTLLIPAVVLAAGRSSRMGRAKAALPLDGDTFLTRILRTFRDAGVDDIVVVLGHEAEAIAPLLAASGLPARVVINADYNRGQLSSLQAGLALVDRPGVQALLMTLVDVPVVSSATVRAVLHRYQQSRAVVVRPVSGNRHGHPVLLDRSLFGALRSAADRDGAKPVIRAHASAAGDVSVDDEGAFRDVDTMDEYQQLIAEIGAGGRPDVPSADR
jgi:molybdenum cofactor cytidylyltransferase